MNVKRILALVAFLGDIRAVCGFTHPVLVSPSCGYCFQRRSASTLLAEAQPGEVTPDASAAPAPDGGPSTTVGAAIPTVDVTVESKLNLAQQKASLMRLILSTSMGDSASEQAAEDVNSIIDRLEGLKQGFQEDRVDGEWVLCFTRNSAGSPSLQKAMPGDRGFQNFDVKSKMFFNIVKFWGGKVQVRADLSYSVKPSNPDRLEATIIAAGVKFGPVRVPLPFKGRVGYLEFVYQDEDIRVTRGDRGGLFLHMRPGSSFSMESSKVSLT